ncbi:sugar kinase [Francisella sp. Scap27]|uniref:sugar kinase n=1 Tax=Francisella sp. Scap27 TaxID=2589986 RepID=UPI0015BA4C8C|nr:sugar kinase [Francisella sp. Scap27]QLE78924.1 sugar kinase [Francisella sp. Scap27]
MHSKLLAIGECMLELSGNMQLGSQTKLNFGGDVLNTAVYYARLGGSVSFLTAMGQDDFSNQVIKAWDDENIDTKTVLQLQNRVPGLYAIQTDEKGERSFHYWREEAPIKDLFNYLDKNILVALTNQYKYIYFSGISISRWDVKQLEVFSNWLKQFRENSQDKEIIFDLNYRPRCWGDTQQAKEYLAKILPFVTTVITTFDDEQLLFDDIDYTQTLERYIKHNVGTIIIKHGSNPTIVLNDNDVTKLTPLNISNPTDTTAAGDSFNAAFLASIENGMSMLESIKFAQEFAAEIIQHRGAIIDKQYTIKYTQKLQELSKCI